MLKDHDDPTSHEVTVLADKDLPVQLPEEGAVHLHGGGIRQVSLAVLERERAYRGPGAV